MYWGDTLCRMFQLTFDSNPKCLDRDRTWDYWSSLAELQQEISKSKSFFHEWFQRSSIESNIIVAGNYWHPPVKCQQWSQVLVDDETIDNDNWSTDSYAILGIAIIQIGYVLVINVTVNLSIAKLYLALLLVMRTLVAQVAQFPRTNEIAPSPVRES